MPRPYIDQTALQIRVGGQTLLTELTDDAQAGTIDTTVTAQAIDGASDALDGAAGRGGYEVPLADTDAAYMSGFLLDIANYRLKVRRGKASDDDRKTYEDAMAILEKLATGDFTLPSSGGSAGGTVTDLIGFDGYEQLCNRDRLQDL